MRQVEVIPEALSLDEVREVLKNSWNRPVLRLKRWAALSFSILQSEEVARSLVSMNWRLVRTTSHNPFVTSDCPVCPCVIDGRRAMFGSLFDHPAVEVTFPLSPWVCLILSRKEPFLQSDSDGAILKEINRRTVFMAERFVFAADNSSKVQRLVSELSYTRRISKIGRYLPSKNRG